MADPKSGQSVVGSDPASTGSTAVIMRPYLFALELTFLLVLVVAPVVYFMWPELRAHIPSSLGFVPIGVPYWGALGAVTSGMYGIYIHNRKWDYSYDYWYCSLPLIGGVLGTAAYLIFIIAIDTTGSKAKHSGLIVYYLVAFLIGYAQDNFHDLVTRATAVVFGGGKSNPGPGPSRDAQ
jgi:hypothetical protein